MRLWCNAIITLANGKIWEPGWCWSGHLNKLNVLIPAESTVFSLFRKLNLIIAYRRMYFNIQKYAMQLQGWYEKNRKVEKEKADGNFKGTHSTKIWQDIYKNSQEDGRCCSVCPWMMPVVMCIHIYQLFSPFLFLVFIFRTIYLNHTKCQVKNVSRASLMWTTTEVC